MKLKRVYILMCYQFGESFPLAVFVSKSKACALAEKLNSKNFCMLVEVVTMNLHL